VRPKIVEWRGFGCEWDGQRTYRSLAFPSVEQAKAAADDVVNGCQRAMTTEVEREERDASDDEWARLIVRQLAGYSQVGGASIRGSGGLIEQAKELVAEFDREFDE
jgi:hypothetical protein